MIFLLLILIALISTGCSVPFAYPSNAANSGLFARAAFTNNEHLWLIDGSQAGAKPVRLTKDGAVQILGWSPDGQWLAWSQDGSKLAFIQGGGREATNNKQLCIVNMPQGRISCYGGIGRVDTQPMWMPNTSGLLFCRGLATTSWGWGGKQLSGFLVSDHRIWLAGNDGSARPLTGGPEDSASMGFTDV